MSTRRLFIDNEHIASKKNLIRRYHPAVKCSENPVLVPDLPWERSIGHSSGTIRYDDGLFRLWYQVYTMPDSPVSGIGTFHIAYAESDNGYSWRKPHLGIVDFHGSRKNNLVMLNAGWGNFFEDPHETDSARKFKMLYLGQSPKESPGTFKGWMGMPGYWGWCAAYSPDGFLWTPDEQNPVFTFGKDGGIPFGWDERIDKYVAYIMPVDKNTWSKMVDPPSFEELADEAMLAHPIGRMNGYTVSDDFIRWEKIRTVIGPVEDDPPAMEFYPMAVSRYQGLYLALIYCLYCRPDNPLPRKKGLMDVQLAASRDGIHWSRLGGHAPYIPCGSRGSFDAGMVGPNFGLIEKDGLIWHFYNAWTGEHNETKAYRRTQDPGLWEMGRKASSMGLARCRQDGFVSLEAGEDEGELETKPLNPETGDFVINAEVLGSGGRVRVEVVNAESGNPVEGYTMDDNDVFRGNEVAHSVSWKGKDASALAGSPATIRFRLRHARLYSYSFG